MFIHHKHVQFNGIVSENLEKNNDEKHFSVCNVFTQQNATLFTPVAQLTFSPLNGKINADILVAKMLIRSSKVSVKIFILAPSGHIKKKQLIIIIIFFFWNCDLQEKIMNLLP